MQTKLIFITGGVVSSLGKGITAASLGRLLKSRGYRISMMKLDPYLNIDPGTMNPYQHGEVYVTDDGAECDLDIGHYERFTGERLTRLSNATTGQIFSAVIERERQGGYDGATVQIIPHITDEIKARIRRLIGEATPDILIVEIGGTVGDIESQPFLEAIRQLRLETGEQDTCCIHVTLVPFLAAAGELKSKPTQHSVKELQGAGIRPDVLICRCERPIGDGLRQKISLFCNVPKEAVIPNLDAGTLYEVPLLLERSGLCRVVLQRLGLCDRTPDLSAWERMVALVLSPKRACRVAVVGKYVELPDAYLSVVEALRHGATVHGASVEIKWVSAEYLEGGDPKEVFRDVDGILVPGGFGARGLEGKMIAARVAREQGIPYLGLCLGMQVAVIEFCRSRLGWADANSTEASPETRHPVIDLMPDQKDNLGHLGGTLRLGLYDCGVRPGTLAEAIYQKPLIQERHRHRYEFNNRFRDALEAAGMRMSGVNPQRDLVEIIELPDHPWFVGVQFHPELCSRPDEAHPLFAGFVGACLGAPAEE